MDEARHLGPERAIYTCAAETRRNRNMRADVKLILGIALLAGVACVQRLPLDAAPCPCSVGYCCRMNKCVLGACETPVAPGTGGQAGEGGSAGSGTAGGGAAGTDTAGTTGAAPLKCVPSMAECVSPTSARVCQVDGSWGAPFSCAACSEGVCSCDTALVNDLCPDDWKTVFVSSMMYEGGMLGGLEGADAKCQDLAIAASLPGTYRAWLSDSTGSPSTRFTRPSGPYRLVDGSVVANDWMALTTSVLRHAIDLTESGATAPMTTACNHSPPVAFTDTNNGGSIVNAGFSCGDWSDPNGLNPAFGMVQDQTAWTSGCGGGRCSELALLYCFEQ
jgi:hypothetical protein